MTPRFGDTDGVAVCHATGKSLFDIVLSSRTFAVGEKVTRKRWLKYPGTFWEIQGFEPDRLVRVWPRYPSLLLRGGSCFLWALVSGVATFSIQREGPADASIPCVAKCVIPVLHFAWFQSGNGGVVKAVFHFKGTFRICYLQY